LTRGIFCERLYNNHVSVCANVVRILYGCVVLFQRKSATLAEQLRHEKAAAIALVKEEAERRIQEEAEAAKVSNTTHTPFGAAAAISFFGGIYSKKEGKVGRDKQKKAHRNDGVCVGLSLGFVGRHEEERGQAKSRS
jgi:hypothetical protein